MLDEDLQTRISDMNASKGFHDRHEALISTQIAVEIYGTSEDQAAPAAALTDYYTSRVALIITEAAEAIEELRDGRAPDETYENPDKPGKPEGVPSELADVVIRAFDLADQMGFSLADTIETKLSYNETRERMHGRKF